jgi:co-chaperonin GroES (HSP10)
MKLKPMADKIVVKPDVRELSSIIYVENKEVENMGVVIAVGPGKKLPNCRREAMPVEVGSRIRFGTMNDDKGEEYLKYFPYEEDGVRYLVMSWQDVCFIQEEQHGN